jgi:D-alanyl-D-alanine endopeptidase (penicillin-binding protein 7)
MPIQLLGSPLKVVPMHRSLFARTLRVCAVLLSFTFVMPAVGTADAKTTRTKSSSKRTASKIKSATKRTTRTGIRSTRRSSRRSTVKRTKRYSAARSRARRARLARARAAVYARELRALQTPQFRIDANGERIPDVRAEAAIIYNPMTQEVLWEENAQNPRSIASITKVMTAVVFLERPVDLASAVVVEPADVRAASTTYLRAYEELTAGDLLHLLLLGSDNAAARALARVSPHGRDGFIDRMNAKAAELGLENTHYLDPSGLNPGNVSSAFDMARLISLAVSDERIGSIMAKSQATISTSRRDVTVRNTNKLIGGDFMVRGGKTGFIRKAGYCLATLLQLPQGDSIAVVVLGARSSSGRFMETRHLFNWLADRTKGLLDAGSAKTQDQMPE